MAIKLLPNDLGNQPSLNAFVLHSMAGTTRKHTLDLSIDNAPPLGGVPAFRNISTALRLQRDLEKADANHGAEKPDVSFRPVNLFAEHKEHKSTSMSPRWLRLSAATDQRINQDDFRNELRVENYTNSTLRYSIEVAGYYSEATINEKKSKAEWQTIGELELTQSVTSAACDFNLHFQHPAFSNEK